VGRLEKVKNLPRLLDAFKRVLDEGLDLQLLLVGEGPMEEELRKQSAQLNLSNRVTFAGKQQGSELYAHYGLGEALILPSTQELFGATVAEAMALGLPVAVSEIASSHELIHSESVGNTLSPLSTDDIAYSLKHLYLLIERARGKSSRGSILPKPFSQYMSNLDEYLGRLIAERFNRIDNSKRMNDGTLP
jgi:glycosyltransferase, group 1 family